MALEKISVENLENHICKGEEKTIKTKNGAIKCKGTGADLCTDLSIIVRSLYEDFKADYDEEFAKHMLTKAFELGLKTEEEIELEAKAKVLQILKLVVGDLEGKEEEHE